MTELGSAPLPPLGARRPRPGPGRRAAGRRLRATSSARTARAGARPARAPAASAASSATSRCARSTRAPGRPPARPRRPALQGALLGDARRALRRPGPARGPASVGARRALGLDVERFDADRRSEAVLARVQRDFDGASAPGVATTPTLFVDGRPHAGVPCGRRCSLRWWRTSSKRSIEVDSPPTDRWAGRKGTHGRSDDGLRRDRWYGDLVRDRQMAKQASGAVVVRAGDTMVLCTATAGNLRDVDFLPLTVDVEERMYAAGRSPARSSSARVAPARRPR